MKVSQLQIADLKHQINTVGADRLAELYPGPFLAAIGVLSASEQEEQRQRLRGHEPPQTVSIAFGDIIRLQDAERHALAGVAFHLQSELRPDKCLVGRSKNCEVRIDNPSVSDIHAVLTLDGERLWVADVGSTNGTRVNFERIADQTEHPLEAHQMVTFGRYTFWLMYLGELVKVM